MFRMCAVALCLLVELSGTLGQEPKRGDTQTYVEFDFSTMPNDGEGKYSLTLTVLTTDKDLKYSMELKGPRKFDREARLHAPRREDFLLATLNVDVVVCVPKVHRHAGRT